ncbi:MAG TPA: DUF4350 domain-containing protein [Burkholderiaceae bacterium]|jgi:hypothetical protein|nr:DUF4350 domain-containing protein [Burkholderiaceae bacterium]
MKVSYSHLIAPLLAILVAAAATWWWYDNMEKRWQTRNEISTAAENNPMLAATMLLTRHRHTVTTDVTLGTTMFKPLPHGTLILAGNDGVMTTPQRDFLLAWVAKGNILITVPAAQIEEINQSAQQPQPQHQTQPGALQRDPLGVYFGVRQTGQKRCAKPNTPKAVAIPDAATATPVPIDVEATIDCVATLTMPNGTYPLRMDAANTQLRSWQQAKEMLLSDDRAEAIRAYAHGEGRVIFVTQNYFDNDHLPLYDHAELLLNLVNLSPDGNAVVIVQRPDVPSWLQALWALAPLPLIALAVGLLLWGWRAVRRFGPLLPEPDLTRRALLEHVDASSRWLWKTAKGRTILLDATRVAVEAILRRRLPALQTFTPQEKIAHLAQQTHFSHADLISALHNEPAARATEFTRQIQTLQRLRKHYERKS